MAYNECKEILKENSELLGSQEYFFGKEFGIYVAENRTAKS